MKKKTINKSIDINASREKVWEVLLADKYTRIWYAEFSEGSHAETDWQVGSKAVFTDKSNRGMVGRIIENNPNDILTIEYDGIVIAEGKEDYDSDMAKAVKGGRETYILTDRDGITHLEISGDGDMNDDFLEMMSVAWDKALIKVKNLSESI